jgi:hypothetical protein
MLLTDSRAPSPPALAAIGRASLLKPSPADFVLASILVWAFAAGKGWLSLLADGDTGWHIRTGDWILRTGRVPTHDLFSFSKEGQPWFAWEWLSDVCLAILHRNWGLRGVVIFSGLVLSVSILLLFRWMLWRNAGFFGALAVAFLATGAASVHFLARPHIFTFLLMIVSLWMLDRDRKSATPLVWILVPLCALWTNLHGGFLALIACLVLLTAASLLRALFHPAFRRRFAQVKRYGLLTAACSCATLINPFGYHLHQHIVQYLRSGWIINTVDEFQSPKFRSENMLQFEVLLFLGLLFTAKLLRGRRFFEAALILFWAQAALKSVRHAVIRRRRVAADCRRTECAVEAVGRAHARNFHATDISGFGPRFFGVLAPQQHLGGHLTRDHPGLLRVMAVRLSADHVPSGCSQPQCRRLGAARFPPIPNSYFGSMGRLPDLSVLPRSESVCRWP